MISEVSASPNIFFFMHRKVAIGTQSCLAAQMYPAEGAFVGSDLSGEVVKLGPNLQKDIKIGDVVSASIVGSTSPVSPWRLFSQFHKEKLIIANIYGGLQMSRVDGALSQNTQKRIPTLSGRFPREHTPLKRLLRLAYRRPVAVFVQLCSHTDDAPRLNTAFQALYGSRALGLVEQFDRITPAQDETWIFIYGGSTCVGLYAIQLAKLSGYKIATVASPRNHELLKRYGADVVFDASIFILSASSPQGYRG